jgi:hypothetical protein
VQLEEAEHSADGVLKAAKIALWRGTFRLWATASTRPSEARYADAAIAGRSRTFTEDSASIENEYYRATFDLRTAELTGLLANSKDFTAYPVVEGYEEGVSSDSGLELGKRLTFDYALVPHDGD